MISSIVTILIVTVIRIVMIVIVRLRPCNIM